MLVPTEHTHCLNSIPPSSALFYVYEGGIQYPFAHVPVLHYASRLVFEALGRGPRNAAFCILELQTNAAIHLAGAALDRIIFDESEWKVALNFGFISVSISRVNVLFWQIAQIVNTCASYVFFCTVGVKKASSPSKILILLRFSNGLLRVKIPSKANVGELRQTVGKKVRTSYHAITLRVCGKVLRDDATNLDTAGLITGSIVDCDLHPLRGGGGFKCIKVENLKPLLNTIKADVESKQRKWSWLSNDVQAYFKELGIDPTVTYAKFYSECRHTIATSYVWSATTLLEMAGYC
jgi:hypothetical protein